jgi:hypothetical protein
MFILIAVSKNCGCELRLVGNLDSKSRLLAGDRTIFIKIYFFNSGK